MLRCAIVPSPLVTTRLPDGPLAPAATASSGGTCAMSETKSTNGANDPHAVCWRVSQTFTTPSSSPVATRFWSRTLSLFTADLCACSSLARGLPVAVSKARMDRSDDPVSRSAPSLTKPRVRTDSVCASMVFSFRTRSPLFSHTSTCVDGGAGTGVSGGSRGRRRRRRGISGAIGGGGCSPRR